MIWFNHEFHTANHNTECNFLLFQVDKGLTYSRTLPGNK